jgi:hypothetical protein
MFNGLKEGYNPRQYIQGEGITEMLSVIMLPLFNEYSSDSIIN